MHFSIRQIEELVQAGQAQLVKDMREIARRLAELPEPYDDSEIRKSLADAIASIPKIPEPYDDSEIKKSLADVIASIPEIPEPPAPYDDSELKKSIAAVAASIPEIPEPPAPYDDSVVKTSIRELRDDLISTAEEVRREAEQAERIAKETAADTVNQQMIINAQPVEQWTRGVDYPAGRKVTHHGGTWEAVKQTAAEPGSAAGWLLIADGIKSVQINGDSLQFETASGESHRIKDLKGEAGSSISFKGKWTEGQAYHYNEIAVTDGAAWISRSDDNTDQPPSDNWGCIAQRGPRGRRGEKGDKPDATEIYPLLVDVFDQHYEKLAHETAKAARVPATPEEVEPVAKEAIEQMLPAYHTALRRDLDDRIKKQFEELSIPGVNFRGMYSTSATYATGEIVNYRDGLYIATANNSGQIPDGADSWQLMLEAGVGGRGGAGGLTQSDLVALNTEILITHTFSTSETAVDATSTPIEINNVEIIDTAYGTNTGILFPRGASLLNAHISCYMKETGASTQCLIAFKAAPLDQVNDTANFVDTDFYVFTSSDTNQGTISFSPNATRVSENICFVLTTRQQSSAPTISFESEIVFGRNIPAVMLEITGLRRLT